MALTFKEQVSKEMKFGYPKNCIDFEWTYKIKQTCNRNGQLSKCLLLDNKDCVNKRLINNG